VVDLSGFSRAIKAPPRCACFPRDPNEPATAQDVER
jgi:hypothetical protein